MSLAVRGQSVLGRRTGVGTVAGGGLMGLRHFVRRCVVVSFSGLVHCAVESDLGSRSMHRYEPMVSTPRRRPWSQAGAQQACYDVVSCSLIWGRRVQIVPRATVIGTHGVPLAALMSLYVFLSAERQGVVWSRLTSSLSSLVPSLLAPLTSFFFSFLPFPSPLGHCPDAR